MLLSFRIMVKRLGLVKLSRMIESREDTVEFLRDKGVLPRTVACKKCGKTVEKTGQNKHFKKLLKSNPKL